MLRKRRSRRSKSCNPARQTYVGRVRRVCCARPSRAVGGTDELDRLGLEAHRNLLGNDLEHRLAPDPDEVRRRAVPDHLRVEQIGDLGDVPPAQGGDPVEQQIDSRAVASGAPTAGPSLGLKHPAARDVVRVGSSSARAIAMTSITPGSAIEYCTRGCSRRATTKPHHRRQARWFDTFGCDCPVSSTSSPTARSPSASRSRICSRVGSPNARKYFASTSVDAGASGSRNGASAKAEVRSCNDIRTD